MNSTSRRPAKQNKLYKYFEASKWVLYLIPHLWTEITNYTVFEKAGITPELLKAQEQWFWDCCCLDGQIHPDCFDKMNNEQKFIVKFISSIIEKNHRREKRKGTMGIGYEGHQQRYLQNIQAYDYENAHFYYKSLIQQKKQNQQREQNKKSGHEQNNYGKSKSSQQQDHKNGDDKKQEKDVQGSSNQSSNESTQLQKQDNIHKLNRQECSQKQLLSPKRTQVQQPKAEEKQQLKNELEPLSQSNLQSQIKKFSFVQFKKMINETQEKTIRAQANPGDVRNFDEMRKWETEIGKINVIPQSVEEENRAIQTIVVGPNQSYETVIERKRLQERATLSNFAKMKQEEEKLLAPIQKAKRSINLYLLQIAPNNHRDIASDLEGFAIQSREICTTLIRLIIQKAWEQPQYTKNYADICWKLTRIQQREFKFDATANKNQSFNSFKYLLMDEVQSSLDEQSINFPKFADDFEKAAFLSELKKKMIGNAQFIAALIKFDVLNKNTMRNVLQQLIGKFFTDYYTFVQKATPESSLYSTQFEVIIRFLENLGKIFEKIAIPKDKKEKSYYQEVKKMIKELADGNIDPVTVNISTINLLSANQLFKTIFLMNEYILKNLDARINYLLKNLKELRQRNWVRFYNQFNLFGLATKLRDLAKEEQEEIAELKQKIEVTSKVLKQKMKKLLSSYVANDQEWRSILEELTQTGLRKSDVYSCYLRLVAEDKKDFVIKKLEIFTAILNEKFSFQEFQEGWKTAVKELAYLASDMPFCGAALSKILITLSQNYEVKFEEFFIEFDEVKQEDEFWFMMQIYQKLYHYSQNQSILNFVQAKPKLSHLL